MSWKYKSLLGFNESFLSLCIILMHFLPQSCSVAIERAVVVLGGPGLEMIMSTSVNRSDDMVVGEVGSGRWEQRGSSYGTAGTQTVRWLPSHQPTASGINRKGSHVKKKPFQLQPLELQRRTHLYIHTSKNTLAHKRVHVGSVRVQRLTSVTTRGEWSGTFGTYTAALC